MKTETELKETWCPYVLASIIQTNGNHAANRYAEGGNHPNANCIGFACSQCVDGGAEVETKPIDQAAKSPEDSRPDGDGWKVKGILKKDQYWRRKTGERHAYCGRNIGEALRQELYSMIERFDILNQ